MSRNLWRIDKKESEICAEEGEYAKTKESCNRKQSGGAIRVRETALATDTVLCLDTVLPKRKNKP